MLGLLDKPPSLAESPSKTERIILESQSILVGSRVERFRVWSLLQ